MNEQAVEQEIQDKGLTAPRLTPADIDATIASELFHVFEGTTHGRKYGPWPVMRCVNVWPRV